MKLSEVNLSTKNVEQINNIKKAPVILNQRMTKPVSDSFVNTSISKKEEKQNFLQKAWNKLKTIFSSKKEVNSSIQNENLDLDITSSIKNSTVSFKGPKKVNKATDREALISLNKSTILNSLNISESELTAFINRDNVKVKYPVSVDNIVATLLSNNIPVEDFIEVYNSKKEVSDNNFEGKALARTMNVLKNYSQIVCKEVFEPFNLNFKDVDKVLDAITSYDFLEIDSLLEAKKPEVYETLILDEEKPEQYSEKLENTLTELYDGINTSTFVYSNPEHIASLTINGKNKQILFPNIGTINPEIIPIDKDNCTNKKNEITALFIKSNLMTMDLIKTINNGDYSISKGETCSSKVPVQSGTIELTFSVKEIIDKAIDKGIDSLSTHEIHAITDKFLNLYVENTEFQKLSKEILKKSNDLKQVYGYVTYMKNKAEQVLSKENVRIETHALMRMLDRNLVTFVDNQNNHALSFEEFLQVLANNAKKANSNGEFFIDGKKRNKDKLENVCLNGSTIKGKVTKDNKGTIVIDSIMLQ